MDTSNNSLSGMATVAGANLIVVSREFLDNITTQIKELNERVAATLPIKPKPNIYTNKTIKELLGIQDKLLKRYRDDGLLPYHQIGDKYWYTQADIEQFLSTHYYPAYAIAG